MDYEEDDSQTLSRPLAGEGINKHISDFGSYDLPKFDLDVQGNIRFDNLVETEVFLGIENQDNWIEDFSHGSKRVEIDFGATESVSVLRHNNVWSEAASSESVAMLLKSVGEEEPVQEQTITEQSHVCDDINSSMKRPETNLAINSDTHKINNDVDSSPTLLESDFLGGIPGVNIDTGNSLQPVVVVEGSDDKLSDLKMALDLEEGIVKMDVEKQTNNDEDMQLTEDKNILRDDSSKSVGKIDSHDMIAPNSFTDSVGLHKEDIGNNIAPVSNKSDGENDTAIKNYSPQNVQGAEETGFSVNSSSKEFPITLSEEHSVELAVADENGMKEPSGVISQTPKVVAGPPNFDMQQKLNKASDTESSCKDGSIEALKLTSDGTVEIQQGVDSVFLSQEQDAVAYRKGSDGVSGEDVNETMKASSGKVDAKFVSNVSTTTAVCSTAELLRKEDLDGRMSRQSDGSSKDQLVTMKDEQKFDAEPREGNQGTEGPSIGDEEIVVQHDRLFTAATGRDAEVGGSVTVNAVAENVDSAKQTDLLGCSDSERLPSIDMSRQLEAVISNSPGPIGSKKATSNDVVPHEINKEAQAPATGNIQDELSMLTDKDKSTNSDEPLSSHISTVSCSGTSKQEMEIPSKVVKHLESSDVNNVAIDKKSSDCQDPKVPDTSEKENSFSFAVGTLPNPSDRDVNNLSKIFSMSQASSLSETAGGFPVPLIAIPKGTKKPRKQSQIAEGAAASKGSKGNSEPRRRQSASRKSGKRGNHPSESTSSIPLDREPANSLIPAGSSTPDLKFSTSLPAMFQQPFTDLQQLQLRAQIFVYGSLMQGNAPDEACLMSAFGGSDGGRSIWEKAWQMCVEKKNNQLAQISMKNPVIQSRGIATPDQASKPNAVENKVKISPISRAGKGNPSHVVSPMIPLSSPLWNIHTSTADGTQLSGIPRAAVVDQSLLPPLHPLHTPAISIGPGASRSSLAPSPVPWVASPQTRAWDSISPLSALPNPEPVKLIPVGSSVVSSSRANHIPADPLRPIASTAGASTTGASIANDPVFRASSRETSVTQTTKEQKSRKRKKVKVSGETTQASVLFPSSNEPVHVNHSSVMQPGSATAAPYLHNAADISAPLTTPLPSMDRVMVENKVQDGKVILSEETLQKVDEAKSDAEKAAACAEAAVSHSQRVWSQLDKQKNSGITSDVEAKVASAAVAVAAAASVAKAAAAAARLAADAALQAKLMAEESMILRDSSTLSYVSNLAGGVTPASILQGENKGKSSSSVIVAAKEAARRKIESAVAASKHAENLDAIVKAAELAAEAVTQAGKVVAMGDPLSLSSLIEFGPEGYWKVPELPSQHLKNLNIVKGVSCNNEVNGGGGSSINSKDALSDVMAARHTELETHENPTGFGTISLEMTDNKTKALGHVTASIANKDLSAKVVVPIEGDDGVKSPSLTSYHDSEKREGTTVNYMKEGSIIEVFKEWGSVKAAWFAAKVIELKDGEVYVSYIKKRVGDGQYKEWIALACEDNTAPIVRIAHPETAMPSEGLRKRRRTAIGSRSWNVGDKVDAWMQDCWWEGFIIEKNSKDESSLTIQFPAQGESSVVKAWNLRPSLIWKDGEWVQWSNPNESTRSRHEGDTPRGKRQKVSIPPVDIKGKGNIGNVNLKAQDHSRLTGLPEKEKLFNIGNSSKDDGKFNAQRMVRTGLQKQGSNVIFGIPTPGKKRKFMDVSKHFDAGGKSKVIGSKETQKSSRVPISRGPNGWKNSNSRTETQQKTASEVKPKALKSGKAPSASDKRSIQKETNATSASSDVNEGRENNTIGSGNTSGIEIQAEPDSLSDADGAFDGSILISSLARPPSSPSSKKLGMPNMKPERASRGKLEFSRANTASVEEDKVACGTTDHAAPDTEPRRSIRRINPTSRLLEGLQTSLSISKVPPSNKTSLSKGSS